MLLEIHKIFLNLVRKADISLSVTNEEGGQVNIKNSSLAETVLKRLKVINYIRHPKREWGLICDTPANTFNSDIIDLNKTLISLKVNNNYTINVKLQYDNPTMEITKFSLFMEVVHGKYEKVSISEENKLITNVKTFNDAPWISISLYNSSKSIGKDNNYPIEPTTQGEYCGNDVKLFSSNSDDKDSRNTAFPEIRELVVDIIENNIRTNSELSNLITEMIEDGEE